jgi:hypothetical protein
MVIDSFFLPKQFTFSDFLHFMEIKNGKGRMDAMQPNS